jgi:cysteine desulfurase
MTLAHPANPDPAYLDYAATTPVDPRVAARMAECLTSSGTFGNPGSVSHAYGTSASALVEGARAQVAAAVGAAAEDIVWTSGATEANNLVLFGIAHYYRDAGRHIVTSRTEHKAVLDPCRELERRGWRITYLIPDRDGAIHPAQVAEALQPDTVLVSLMHVNNETGVIQDIPAISAVCARHGSVRLHVDAAQSVGKVAVDFSGWGLDLLSLSAHKTYGPKGVGALAVSRRRRVQLQPLQFGGGQERHLRSGTVPTHQVVGMGAAFELAACALREEPARVGALRERLWAGLERLGGVLRNGAQGHTVPQILNVSFEDVEGESLLAGVRSVIAVSTGSACTSATRESSYVLRALGRDERLAEASLRFSLGRFSAAADIDTAIDAVARAVRHLRHVGGVVARAARSPVGATFAPGRAPVAAGRGANVAGRGGSVHESVAPLEQSSWNRPPNYNDLTWRHFSGAAYAGVSAGEGVHCAAAGSPEQGTWVQFNLQIGRSGAPVIQDARFQAYGCPHVIAVADWLTQNAVGREAAGAHPLRGLPEPVGALRERFDVPVEKLGRLLLVEDAWKAALASLYAA